LRNADRVTAALLLAFSVAFAAGALKQYQWWGSGGPGPAFLPFWLGLVMACLALGLLFRSIKQADPGAAWFPRGEGLRDMLVVLGVTIVFVTLLSVLGMVIGTALYLAVLIGYLGRHRWWVTLSVAVAAAGFNWLVFVRWLRVPFPEGMLWIF
jgi:putative tricarboxylic transport membrane protein